MTTVEPGPNRKRTLILIAAGVAAAIVVVILVVFQPQKLFEVENGPDLRVYLSKASDNGSYDSDFVDLGALKGNIGDQNFEIPEDTNLDAYTNAVVWCRMFSTCFAVAGLR